MFLAYTSLLRNSDSDYQVIHMSKWPTKLLPCIANALYGLIAHGSAARDDACLAKKHVHRQRVF